MLNRRNLYNSKSDHSPEDNRNPKAEPRAKTIRKDTAEQEAKSPEEWVQETIAHFLISGKRQRTAETYAREVGLFCRWLKDSPLEASEEDLKRFVIYRLNECKLSGSSMRILCVGMKGFFEHVLKRDWPVLETMRAKHERPLPVVLTREEVWRVLNAVRQLRNRAYLQTVYSCGLRLSEALNLTVHDIDAARNRLHVRHGKGGKDRFVPLPLTTLQLLRTYWATHRNAVLIFPARSGTRGKSKNGISTTHQTMAVSSVQGAMHRALDRSALRKPGVRIHTLRHCYACHLLEAGVHIRAIQLYLGHATLMTTVRYLHIAVTKLVDYLKLINDLMKGGK